MSARAKLYEGRKAKLLEAVNQRLVEVLDEAFRLGCESGVLDRIEVTVADGLLTALEAVRRAAAVAEDKS